MIKKRWKEILVVSALGMITYFSLTAKDEQTLQAKNQQKTPTMQWLGFDSLSFGDAFNQMYKENGRGYVFTWRGKAYLTQFKEDK